VNVVIGFFMMPFLVFRLGDTLYGIWTLIISLVGYGSLLDFGIRSSIVKYVSQHHATNERDRLLSLFATTLISYSAVGVVVLILAGAGALFLPRLFSIPPELCGDAQLVLLIVGFNLALKFPAGVFEGFLVGLQRYEIINSLLIGSTLLRSALIAVLIMLGKKLLAVAAISLITDVLGTLGLVFACLHLLPWLSFKRQHLSTSVLREVYVFGFFSSLLIVASRVIYDSDSIVIGAFLPAAAITHFAIANNFVRYLRQAVSGFGNVFAPAASDLEARNKGELLAKFVTEGTKYALTVILPVVMVLTVVGYDFLSLWMGRRYAEESGSVLIILALSQVVGMSQFPAVAMLYGVNRHRDLAFIFIGEAFFKVALSVLLIRPYGLNGVAIGTAVPDVFASLIIARVVARCFGLPYGTYLRRAFSPPIVSILPAAVLLFAMRMVIPPASWPLFLGEVGCSLLVYISMTTRWCIDERQRASLYGMIRRRIWSSAV
jgi:O-antigen/teichoic acid export membrane protein